MKRPIWRVIQLPDHEGYIPSRVGCYCGVVFKYRHHCRLQRATWRRRKRDVIITLDPGTENR